MYFNLPPMMPVSHIQAGLILQALDALKSEYEAGLHAIEIGTCPGDVHMLTSHAYLLDQIEEIEANVKEAVTTSFEE